MATTFELIDKATVGASGAASVEFTSIPNTYNDLCVLMSLRVDGASLERNIKLNFNGVGGSSYYSKLLYGYGTLVASYSQNAAAAFEHFYAVGANATSNTFANNQIYIPNYTSSNYKSFSVESVCENNGSSSSMGLSAGLFSNTSAISSIKFDQTASGEKFVQYSSFYLYGIKNS